MAKEVKPDNRLTYEWYVFVMKTGSVERCIGTRLVDDGEFIEVFDRETRTFSAPKSGIVEHWRQDRRVTKAGEQRIEQAHRSARAASDPF